MKKIILNLLISLIGFSCFADIKEVRIKTSKGTGVVGYDSEYVGTNARMNWLDFLEMKDDMLSDSIYSKESNISQHSAVEYGRFNISSYKPWNKIGVSYGDNVYRIFKNACLIVCFLDLQKPVKNFTKVYFVAVLADEGGPYLGYYFYFYYN